MVRDNLQKCYNKYNNNNSNNWIEMVNWRKIVWIQKLAKWWVNNKKMIDNSENRELIKERWERIIIIKVIVAKMMLILKDKK